MACTEAVETVIGEHYDESVLIFFGSMEESYAPRIQPTKILSRYRHCIQASRFSEKLSGNVEMTNRTSQILPSSVTLNELLRMRCSARSLVVDAR
jgi:demethoxyubiquinone hydroxylase (CLK1/Coq7/Cat5 family)